MSPHPSRRHRLRCAADPLGDAVRRMARRTSSGSSAPPPVEHTATGPEATGGIDYRVAELERQVQEVRTRINALFFAVLAAALGDLAGRLVLG